MDIRHPDAIQTYLSDHAEKFIAYIVKRADEHTNLSDLFETLGGDRLIFIDQPELADVLNNETFQNNVGLRIRAWKPHYTEESIEATRTCIRDYYFEPLRKHAAWQDFISQRPHTPQLVFDQIASAFSYAIILTWVGKHTEDRHKLTPLKLILHSNKSHKNLCKEFEIMLLNELQDKIDELLLRIFDGDIKENSIFKKIIGDKDPIQKVILDALTSIQESEDVKNNPKGKKILWNRILNFLDNKMKLQSRVIEKEKNDNDDEEKTVMAAKEFDKKTKSTIAKGILDYIKTIPTDELANDKNFITLSSIIGEASAYLSKNNKEYKDLLAFSSKKPSTKSKRDAYVQVHEDRRPVYAASTSSISNKVLQHVRRSDAQNQLLGEIRDRFKSSALELDSGQRIKRSSATQPRSSIFTFGFASEGKEKESLRVTTPPRLDAVPEKPSPRQ